MARRPRSELELFNAPTSQDPEAEKVSKQIDEELRKEADRLKRKKSREVKVMLLGQAESGKSTLQKQFQLHYAAKTLERERPTWRPIVLFNIIQAVRTIMEELDLEFFSHTQTSSSTSNGLSSSSSSLLDSSISELQRARWKADFAQVRARLLPLTAIEESLASDLVGGVMITRGRTGFVRAGWQSLLSGMRARAAADNTYADHTPGTSNLAIKALSMVQDDVVELWNHPAVKKLIKLRKIVLQESAAYFLNNVSRIAISNYIPTTEDILNVRIQTLGVTEHSFEINVGGQTMNWLLYDVGGARHAWVPYFDDATAIIFLAPISAFDQYLEEDPRTNRIDDSLQLWTMVCSNLLLKNAHLVLMLNKTDLLREKLNAGIKVRKYITSYGDRPNTYEEASEYFRAHFLQVHRRKDVGKRAMYVHFTSMLDVQATRSILAIVGEAIIRSYMESVGLS
ncbi:G-protein alpha subunit [Thelephora ganbajun]|uniref:G-protein alpha subunit n=1 Tax=Thelephora ganbajun TaxID=370292 RepID=A0ACB6ZM03_THEGA|nr:G-protein alpha subunit [Thelephora ganbajun]